MDYRSAPLTQEQSKELALKHDLLIEGYKARLAAISVLCDVPAP